MSQSWQFDLRTALTQRAFENAFKGVSKKLLLDIKLSNNAYILLQMCLKIKGMVCLKADCLDD